MGKAWRLESRRLYTAPLSFRRLTLRLLRHKLQFWLINNYLILLTNCWHESVCITVTENVRDVTVLKNYEFKI